ncbi:MAG: pit accessory protein [Verrucomicrobiales bacterium]|nr:pit accessory protein [Verrucomicrobiales bacterium]
MQNLQQLLGKEDRFFQLLASSAEQAHTAAEALRHFLALPPAQRNLQAFAEIRRKDKTITSEINEILCTSFVSSLEAEDIETLSNSIYKIPKTIEKIAERILLAPQHLASVNVADQAIMLEKCTGVLLQMVKEMQQGLTKVQGKAFNDQLQTIEGEADKAVLELLRGIYNESKDPGRVVFLKDIFELLEKVTDRCRDAGNTIFQIILKNT